jgi:predicted metal-dependent peptidase
MSIICIPTSREEAESLKKELTDKMKDAISSLLYSQVHRTLAYMLTSTTIKVDWSIPTAAMSHKGDMLLNPYFFMTNHDGTINGGAATAIIYHEYAHYGLRHHTREVDKSESRKALGLTACDKTMANIAMDFTINLELFGEDGKGTTNFPILKMDGEACGIYWPELKSKFKVDATPGEAWESIYDKIEQSAEQNPEVKDMIDKMKPHDNHGGGEGEGEGDGRSERQKANDAEADFDRKAKMARAAADRHDGHRQGNEVGMWDKLMPNTSAKVNLRGTIKAIVSKMMGDETDSEREYVRTLPHKTNQEMLGRRRSIRFSKKMVILFDTSGSMASMLDDLSGVIMNVSRKEGCIIDLYLCDTQVTVRKGVSNLAGVEFTNGGTDLRVAQQKILQDRIPADTTVLMVTDGYTPWLAKNDGWHFHTVAIYTPQHQKIDGVITGAIYNR